jgi:hypothetical protein
MSSIFSSFGSKRRKYKELKILKSKELKDKKTVILLVLDGLGYNYLKKNGKGTFLLSKIKGRMTSVFPGTTATAISTFNTGLAPAEHGIPGWDLFSKEIGAMIEVLRHRDGVADFRKIIWDKKVFSGMNVKSFLLLPKGYDSEYNFIFNENYKTMPYGTLNDLFSKMRLIARKKYSKRKYVFAYWPMMDGHLHLYGTESRKAKLHLREIDKKVRDFAKSIRDTNTMMIVTADHGLNNIKKKIILNSYPKFLDLLVFPPAGDSRVKYCFVKSGKENEFRNYVKKKLGRYCQIKKSSDLLKERYFGFPPVSKKLIERIGDYTLIAKDDCTLKYLEPGKTPNKFKGHHSGMSEDEMYVPLIVIHSQDKK